MKQMMPAITLMMLLIMLMLGCAPVAPATAPAASPTTGAPAISSSKAGWQVEWEKTVSAAQKEGELLVYMHLASEARTPIVDAFKKKFGITLDALTAPSPDLLARINAEYRAGVHRVDVYIGGVSALTAQVKPLGYLSPLQPALILPEVKDPKLWLNSKLPFFDEDGTAFSWLSIVSPGVIYNTNLVKKGEIGSYLDLLRPEWKEKIIVSDPTAPGAAVANMRILADEWGLDKAKEYLSSITQQQKAVVTRDQYQSTEWVARGKLPVGLFPQTPTVAQLMKEGVPLATPLTKEPKHVTTSNGGLAIPTKSPHPNATIVFVNWLLSREGQTVVAEAFAAQSARVDVPPKGVTEILRTQSGQRYTFQSEEGSKREQEFVVEWKRVLGQ